MDKKSIAALYRDLPDLVAKGVLTEAAARDLKNHYGPVESNPGLRIMLIFGVIGVLLVGLGIILLIAHNWAQLTRSQRLALSAGLLIAAQSTAGLALYTKPASRTWREAAAVLHTLAVGAALALVGQTYHLTSDTDSFLLTWMLLVLPLMYLLQANSTAILYLLGVTAWSFGSHSLPDKQLVWLLLAMAFPYYWRQIRSERFLNATAVLSWVWNLALFGCFAAALDGLLHPLRALTYSALFGMNYLIGVLWFNSSRQPFKPVGLAGSLIIAFGLTFYDHWRYLNLSAAGLPAAAAAITASLLTLTAIANWQTVKLRGRGYLPFAAAPLAASAAYLCRYLSGSGIAAAMLMNGYVFLLSVWIISSGSRRRSMAQVNAGMLLLALLIGARFLDANLSFVIRGVVFVVLGSGFLLMNWLLLRRKAGGCHEE